MHPYTLDLAPSDYHFLRTLQNPLNSVKLKRLQKRFVKISCRSFLSTNHKSSTVTGLWLYLKNGRRWSNKTVHIWSKKFPLIYEKKLVLLLH